MKDMIKIFVVTGTRADYGIYFPLLTELQGRANVELGLIVTGMHLSPYYGNTVDLIVEDGFSIIGKVDNLLQAPTEANMSKSVGLGILGMTDILQDNQPDVVIVLGDRGEMLAASIAASHLNIPVAHIHGGEVSGSIDESVRHAITKMSHLHFSATAMSAERIVKMGEDPWRVHRLGAPRLDTILNSELPDLQEVKKKYHLEEVEDYYLFVYHPVTTELMGLKEQVLVCLQALMATSKDVIIIRPNSDAGNHVIIEAYDEFITYEKFHFVTNFSPIEYLTILSQCKALVGNSSSGIIEAASFHKPVINIGNRQKGREQSDNVINVKEDQTEIQQALEKTMSPHYQERLNSVENVYGDGNSVRRMTEVLLRIDKQKLINKMIAY